MSKRRLDVSQGQVNLASRDGALYRRALLCHTGTFDGMLGQVVVSEAMLSGIAKRYNEERASTQNENDYVPVLVDHARSADLIMGRLMADLSVEDWTDPGTGELGKGLFGTLRVDDGEAKENVNSGKYAQLSISFDEETHELFEVSFVAVEAARRAIVLSKGEKKMNLESKLAAALKRSETAMARVQALKNAGKATSLAMKEQVESALSAMAEVQEQLGKASTVVKVATLKAQMRGLLVLGKMTKAEFDAINYTALAAMPKEGVEIVLKAYSDRKPSTDVIQHGTSGARVDEFPAPKSAAQMRALMAAQKKGKTATLAAEGDEGEKGEKEAAAAAAPAAEGEGKKEKDEAPVTMGDMDEHIKIMEGFGPAIEKCTSYMKKLGEHVKKMLEMSEEKEPDGDGDEKPADKGESAQA